MWKKKKNIMYAFIVVDIYQVMHNRVDLRKGLFVLSLLNLDWTVVFYYMAYIINRRTWRFQQVIGKIKKWDWYTLSLLYNNTSGSIYTFSILTPTMHL